MTSSNQFACFKHTHTHTHTFLKKKKEKKTNLLKGRRRYVILLIHIWVGFVNVLKRARVCLFEQKRMANGTKNAGIGLFFFLHSKQKIGKKEISVLQN